MALLANSYGSAENVAALVPRYGNSAGYFDHTTRPTLVQVETLMNQVSATLNSILATAGFAIPVTQSDAVLMLALWVDQETAALVPIYRERGLLREVDGIGDIDEIARRIDTALGL